jgi:hypothetical protein
LVRVRCPDLKRRFRLAPAALVGDRGMIISARISEELSPTGLDCRR